MSLYATTPYWSRVLPLVLSARFARLTWSLTPHPPAEASHRPHRPARNQAQIGLAPKMPHWQVDSGDASHLLPTSPGTIPGSRQDLPLSRTVLSNQWLPYVDPFACDWPGLRTFPLPGGSRNHRPRRTSAEYTPGARRAVATKAYSTKRSAVSSARPVC